VFGVMMKDGSAIAKYGFFDGYNAVVWTSVTFQALGGVLVALVVNYADNIAKNFATSISIILSFVASVFFFNFEVSARVRRLVSLMQRSTPLTNDSNSF
jgi:UDP-galactose transporter